MPQAELVEVIETEKGLRLTFVDENNKKTTGIYNLGELTLEDLTKMIGCRISFKGKEDMDIAKAWSKEGRLEYCDDISHILDR